MIRPEIALAGTALARGLELALGEIHVNHGVNCGRVWDCVTQRELRWVAPPAPHPFQVVTRGYSTIPIVRVSRHFQEEAETVLTPVKAGRVAQYELEPAVLCIIRIALYYVLIQGVLSAMYYSRSLGK